MIYAERFGNFIEPVLLGNRTRLEEGANSRMMGIKLGGDPLPLER